jgi:hypothetical protein
VAPGRAVVAGLRVGQRDRQVEQPAQRPLLVIVLRGAAAKYKMLLR